MAEALLVAVTALGFGPASHSFAQGKVVRLTLIDENGSGEDGSAQLTDVGDGTTKVELIMMNGPEGVDQPAGIHEGTCANLDADTVYSLNDVKEGKSTTVVKASLADLTKEKYAISVLKSAQEKTVVFSCGNLPTGTSSSGPMTLDQALAKLLDDATELEGTIKKKEADASQNAYDTYHATFAAHEDEIKAKNAQAQLKLEDAMHGVNDALKAGDWSKSEAAAEKLVSTVEEVQDTLGSTTSTTTTTSASMPPDSDLMPAMDKLQDAAMDVQSETKLKDKDGSQKAYNDFHTVFAANEVAIKAKNPDAQAHIEEAMHEVRDALTANDLGKAGAAADELLKEVNDATSEIRGTTNDVLPKGGSSAFPLEALAVLSAALTLLFAGMVLRRRTS